MLLHYETQAISSLDAVFCAMTYNDGTEDRYMIGARGKRFMFADITDSVTSFIPNVQEGVIFPALISRNLGNPAALFISSDAT